jgi:16S rRNA (adenine1518-N6/adenine1519-N6)-dimethyltransferase
MHKARKRFGQHFLHDQMVIQRIIDSTNPQTEDLLVEIGPGQGALTFPLLKRCSKLTAIELDRDLIGMLQKKADSLGQLTLINEDVLTFDFNRFPNNQKLRVIGNLPYNISTPLMFHLLESSDRIIDMHFMVQKEVALRIVASPGDRNYGRLSLMLQYACQCTYLFEVGPQSFSPPPKVDSAVIRLRPHEVKPADVGEYQIFSEIVKLAFAQRRKTLSNALKERIDKNTLSELDISPKSRAEELSLEDFARISRRLSSNDYE